MLLLSWALKLVIHPTAMPDFAHFVDRSSIGLLRGEFVIVSPAQEVFSAGFQSLNEQDRR